METKRAFLAILLSLGVLLGYQYFFLPPPEPVSESTQQPQEAKPVDVTSAKPVDAISGETPSPAVLAGADASLGATQETRQGKDITVETGLYSAVVSETGGGIKSFTLKKYKESLDKLSGDKQLIVREPIDMLPLFFSWGVEPNRAGLPVFDADQEQITLEGPAEKTLVMTSKLPIGLTLTKTFTFHAQDYRIELAVDVHNTSEQPLQGAPYLSLTNRPFSEEKSSRLLFNGPAALIDGALQEVKPDDLKKKGSQNFTGNVSWTAYEDTYFMCGLIPMETQQNTVHFSMSDENKVTSVLASAAEIIPPQEHKVYKYSVYFGPKKLSILQSIGHGLDKIVNFGWFDLIARPTLYLLNILYKYVHNYGVAIILVTIIIKLLFWPIAQKGMKSMKTMQKIQPKMQKLREKYKDDRERLNQEMMRLYQTYKVNPLGGCLPMLLQIPVFFALYKVLLQTIELRHAPFMLWINDLSAPDRLYVGFDIPFLHGLPVLTLLMGASMFLQQKMTPTSGDPTQAKVMMFLPIIFTVMFVNFASGLVLYWFVNNLLSIAQQYYINRQVA